MEAIYPKQLLVVKAAKGSITNKSEIEEAVKAMGNKVLFVEYEPSIPYQPEIQSHMRNSVLLHSFST